MKKARTLLFVFVLCLSCNNDDTNLPIISACNTGNPIEDLDWLKTQVSELKNNKSDVAKYFYIEVAEYKGDTIFISNNCCPTCNTIVPVYNCKGEQLGLLNGEIKTSEVSNSKIIYKRIDFSCE